MIEPGSRAEKALFSVGCLSVLLVCGYIGYAVISFILDPFGAMTTDIDRELTDVEAAELTLLDERFRLPPGATNVHARFLRFQDSFLYVRLDAPMDTAVEFAEQYLAADAEEHCFTLTTPDGTTEQVGCESPGLRQGCGRMSSSGDMDWWLQDCPEGSRYGSWRWSESPPARDIAVVPHGNMARVYIHTFGD